MKTKMILSLLMASLFGYCHLFAQHQSLFYYYKGNPIPLNVNSQHFLVYADTSKISKDLFAKEYWVTEWIEDGSKGFLEAQVNIPNGNYDGVLKSLKEKEYVIDIEPVIGDSILTNTSRLFYVMLHDAQDYSLLSYSAQSLSVEIRGEVDFCDNWYELRVNKNSYGNSIEVANQFWETGYFANIDPGFILRFKPTSGTICVTDPRFNEQWGMQAINACSAWKITKGDTNVRIAVIDMGVDTSHREFDSTHVVFSYDIDTCTSPAHVYCKEPDQEPPIRDSHHPDPPECFYHGIHVGGIIFANHNRDSVAGICPNAGLIDISHSFKLGEDTAISGLAQSIKRADSLGAKVINNSWGAPDAQFNHTFAPILEQAIEMVLVHNCVVVFAAGNQGTGPNAEFSVTYPANCRPDILVVGAVDSFFTKQFCSSYGPGLDIVAPGEGILSSHYNNGYYSEGGTSMAAPHASGVAGLMFSINPGLKGREVRDIIEQTARKDLDLNYTFDSLYTNGSWEPEVGYGLIDAHRAVLKAAFHKVYGDTTLTLCDTSRHTYTVRAPHNANIDSVSFFWTCSDNLQMVAGQNTDSVWVRRLHSGAGQLHCHIIHAGDTVASTLEIPIASNRLVYDNVSLHNSFTYPDTFVLSREITVDSLVSLTWQNKTVLCTPDCRIVVHPSGYLTINHTTLTSACPGEMWQGIEVVGDRTKKQLPQYQGKVELKNGAVIENAMCGIYAGLHGDATYASAGGIISAANTSFHNNRRAVEINSYAFTPPSGGVSNYNSSFTNCTFSVDANNLFSGNNTAFAEHIRLWDVKGVKFHGCTFTNTTNETVDRGRGVYALDAGVVLDEQCSPDYIAGPDDCECPPMYADTCVFSGFTTAVEVNTSGTPYSVEASRVLFENNVTGLQINGNNYATVTECDFNQQTVPGLSANNKGLVLIGCTGYKVEGNMFRKSSYTPNLLISTGIYVDSSGGATNSLNLNGFTNLNYGVYAHSNNGGDRTGLQITCNVFQYCGIDIYVSAGATMSSNIGTYLVGADNVFQGTRTSSFSNAGNQSITYYCSKGVGHVPYNPVNISVMNSSNANTCAPTLCNNGGGPYVPLTSFVSQVSAYASAVSGTDDDGLAGANDYPPQTMCQTLSETYYNAVRALMSDTVLDLNELEQWHAAAQPIGDPYSLTETRFMEGNSEPFTADAEDAELFNYAEFHAMKLALRENDADNDTPAGANNHSPLQPGGHINWYALTPVQIAQLQTIAERNTGRASVIAKGVLCFFYGICYEDDFVETQNFASLPMDNPDTSSTETRAKRTAMDTDNDARLNVYPNPTDDVLFIELSGGAGIANVALYDLQGRVVETRRAASLQKTTASMDMKSTPAGVYVLRVTDTDGKEYHQKIVRK